MALMKYSIIPVFENVSHSDTLFYFFSKRNLRFLKTKVFKKWIKMLFKSLLLQ